MTDNQQFAADVVALIPEGAVWTFRNHYGQSNFMPGIDCVEVAPSDWQATIGAREKLMFLELLQWEDEDGSYWMFGGTESIDIEFEGKLILRSWDGMNVADFSKDFTVPEAFRRKYFAYCAGYAKDW